MVQTRSNSRTIYNSRQQYINNGSVNNKKVKTRNSASDTPATRYTTLHSINDTARDPPRILTPSISKKKYYV